MPWALSERLLSGAEHSSLPLDPDGRFGKGVASGWNGSIGADAPSSDGFGSGLMLGGIARGVKDTAAFIGEAFAGVPDYLAENGWSSFKRNVTDPKFVLENAVGGFGLAGGVSRGFGSGAQALEGSMLGAAFSDAPVVNLTAFGSSGVDAYQGVKQASQYLRDMGVSRADRVTALQSFDIRTISVQTAGDANFGIRFHDFGQTARPMGQFLTDTFTPLTNRSTMALPVEWNGMTGISQWQIKPGTTMIKGQVGPQLQFGSQFTGGASQTFILEPWKYGTLLKP
jgi:hypothetical protein